MIKEIDVSQLTAFRIGHAQDPVHATGCTAILCEQGAWAGVDVRGGGPATRELALLRPDTTVQQINCVMLSGGSAFGLAAGDGAMTFLEERGAGFDTGVGKVPLVCGASLFDLELVSFHHRPDKAMGYAACENAYLGTPPKEGNVGAGTGATVGKFHNTADMMKSGLGIYAVQVGKIKCAAIVAVNALGDVIDCETGKILAGLLTKDHTGFADTRLSMYEEMERAWNLWQGNTTIGCVITNAKLNKDQCTKAASIAHNGYAQSIRPVHLSADGDTIFVMASGEVEAAPDVIYTLGAQVMAHAVNRAVLTAAPAYGLKAASDFLA